MSRLRSFSAVGVQRQQNVCVPYFYGSFALSDVLGKFVLRGDVCIRLVDVDHTNLGIWYESFVDSTGRRRAYDRLLQHVAFTTPSLSLDWPIERTFQSIGTILDVRCQVHQQTCLEKRTPTHLTFDMSD